MTAAYWSYKLTRWQRFRRVFTWHYIRQSRLLGNGRLIEWWWNRGS